MKALLISALIFTATPTVAGLADTYQQQQAATPSWSTVWQNAQFQDETGLKVFYLDSNNEMWIAYDIGGVYQNDEYDLVSNPKRQVTVENGHLVRYSLYKGTVVRVVLAYPRK